MNLLTIIIGLTLRLTKFRFNKAHRMNETFLYRAINTAVCNQIANGLTIKNYLKIWA